MGVEQDRLFCLECGKPTLHSRPHFGEGFGCILTVMTCGLFLPIWVIVIIVQAFGQMRCQTCGLIFSWEAVQVHMRRLAVARAATQPVAPPPPPQDWTWIGRSIVGGYAAIAGFCGIVASDIARMYRSLPDWALPIVWGLGITAPVIIAAALGRYLRWW